MNRRRSFTRPESAAAWNGKSAFTLIELLVVIAIIAILTAILFPVFAQAREKARTIACLSNEKQLGIAVLQYVQDFDETYPPGNVASSSTSITGRGWASQLYTYVKSTGVFKCPDDSTSPTSTTPVKVPISYALNTHMSNTSAYQGSHARPTGTPLAMLTAPASTVELVEIQGAVADVTNPIETDSPSVDGEYAPHYQGYYVTGYLPFQTQTSSGGQGMNNGKVLPNPVHNGGSNYLAADGHAKFLLPSLVSGGYSEGKATDPAWSEYTPCGTQAMYNGFTKTPYTLTFMPY